MVSIPRGFHTSNTCYGNGQKLVQLAAWKAVPTHIGICLSTLDGCSRRVVEKPVSQDVSESLGLPIGEKPAPRAYDKVERFSVLV